MSEIIVPDRIAKLPKDKRGYYVPWFVSWQNGKPQFPIMDPDKWIAAVQHRLCWICGEDLGAYLVFVAGPSMGISRSTAEPPSHLTCAEFAVKTCPFLINPEMKRIDSEATRKAFPVPGIPSMRNPGVSLVWVTKDYRLLDAGDGGCLITIGDPVSIGFWKEARPATRAEVEEALGSSLKMIMGVCKNNRDLESLKIALGKFCLLLVSSFFEEGKINGA